MKSNAWTKSNENRRHFIGGSDAWIIMGGDEAALLRLWREKWGEAEPEGRAKFRRYFPKGFRDPLYLDWERGYKWTAHQRWNEPTCFFPLRRWHCVIQSGHRQVRALLHRVCTISSTARASRSSGSLPGARWSRGSRGGRRGF